MAESAAGSSHQAPVTVPAVQRSDKRHLTPIASLAVGIAGCLVRVQVIDEDSIRRIEKADTYKALWVVADADGTTIDMDAWNKDRSKLEELVAKLPLGATVIIKGFSVQEQTKKRWAIKHISPYRPSFATLCMRISRSGDWRLFMKYIHGGKLLAHRTPLYSVTHQCRLHPPVFQSLVLQGRSIPKWQHPQFHFRFRPLITFAHATGFPFPDTTCSCV